MGNSAMITADPPELQTILKSPRLPDYADIIVHRLREEAARRVKFYQNMTDELKMEFIEGEVVMHSPARDWHLETKMLLMTALDLHVRFRGVPGKLRDEKCLCVFPRNDYEPDIVFFGPEKAILIKGTTLKFPVPDFVVEILSESTEVRDRGVKFEDYQAHGVKEYWILDPEAQVAEQYVLTHGAFVLRTKSASGELVSEAVPGFRIPIPALFDAEANPTAIRAMFPPA